VATLPAASRTELFRPCTILPGDPRNSSLVRQQPVNETTHANSCRNDKELGQHCPAVLIEYQALALTRASARISPFPAGLP